jgi:hypothetical protein
MLRARNNREQNAVTNDWGSRKLALRIRRLRNTPPNCGVNHRGISGLLHLPTGAAPKGAATPSLP